MMYEKDLSAVCDSAAAKAALFKRSRIGYLLASMLAGLYIGFGVLVMSVTGGALSGQPIAKLANAFVFPVALSLVTFAGSELFTGNTFVMTVGVRQKRIRLPELAGVWILSYLGNLLGSLICAAVFSVTGLLSGGTLEFVLNTASLKMNLSVPALVSRGILCNILVCLAVWSCIRMKSESGKLIMIFWCIFTFVICGFEHSIANMTMLSLSLIAPHPVEISAAGMAYNLFFVTLGNLIGGAGIVAFSYLWIAGKRKFDIDGRG